MSTIMSQIPLRMSRSVFRGITAITSKPRDLPYSTALHKDEKTPTTVDIADVKHHSKIKEQWWDVNGPMKALHAFNLLRVPLVRDGLVQVPPERKSCTPLLGKKILDVGCGGGILSMPLAKLGGDVTGIDASKELVDMAKEHSETNPPATGNKPTYIYTSIEEHATNHTNHYDGVVASEIIEHIDNDKKELFVKSCIHTLKPGGRIFFTTPTRTKISQFTSIFIAEYVLRAIPVGTHQYEKFTTPTELTFLLERNGCHVESVFGIFYHPLQNKWEWITSTAFFFAIQAVKLEEE
ncbi:ubiquinone biosynthesis protein COQ3, mitochondrial [Choristoneura fumiferana]|uniref:ubiquinone biosynthesis protein COQ3, mitochondrial n=1 Tax=Choristoneura fumiferana TaxID=7141 RepID=UPI003D15639E